MATNMKTAEFDNTRATKAILSIEQRAISLITAAIHLNFPDWTVRCVEVTAHYNPTFNRLNISAYCIRPTTDTLEATFVLNGDCDILARRIVTTEYRHLTA